MADSLSTDKDLADLAVLVVDDNANMRRLILTQLRAIGVSRTCEAGSGVEALEILTDFVPDVIITDLAMEPMDGILFVRRLRNDAASPARRVPVVMLTGHADVELVVKARDAGVHDFLVKPASARQLEDRIRRIIYKQRPFVETPTYAGPDRRTRSRGFVGPDRRRPPERPLS